MEQSEFWERSLRPRKMVIEIINLQINGPRCGGYLSSGTAVTVKEYGVFVDLVPGVSGSGAYFRNLR